MAGKFEHTPPAEVKKVVLTGGPVAGKTTAINHLKKVFGHSIVVVPEVATTLLNGGFPKPGTDLEWVPDWQDAFQDAVYHVQSATEKASVAVARQKGSGLVIADRGILDGAAYFPGGRDEFADRYGVDVQATMATYDTVVHLESVAVQGRSLFEWLKESNPARFRPYEEVLALEESVQAAWDGHPNRIMVREYDLDERLLAVEGIVRAMQDG